MFFNSDRSMLMEVDIATPHCITSNGTIRACVLNCISTALKGAIYSGLEISCITKNILGTISQNTGSQDVVHFKQGHAWGL